MFYRPHHLMTAAALTLAAPRAAAVPDELRVNVREGCRQAISGAYIGAYTERERNRTLLRTLAAQMKEVDEALSAARADLARNKREADGKAFDLGHAVQNDQVQARVKALEAQRADNLALAAQAETGHAAESAREKALLTALSKVFTVERSLDRADGGFPIRLEYKSPCPKFRALCPLPVDDAKALVAIPLEGGPPEACTRYATLSKLR